MLRLNKSRQHEAERKSQRTPCFNIPEISVGTYVAPFISHHARIARVATSVSCMPCYLHTFGNIKIFLQYQIHNKVNMLMSPSIFV